MLIKKLAKLFKKSTKVSGDKSTTVLGKAPRIPKPLDSSTVFFQREKGYDLLGKSFRINGLEVDLNEIFTDYPNLDKVIKDWLNSFSWLDYLIGINTSISQQLIWETTLAWIEHNPLIVVTDQAFYPPVFARRLLTILRAPMLEECLSGDEAKVKKLYSSLYIQANYFSKNYTEYIKKSDIKTKVLTYTALFAIAKAYDDKALLSTSLGALSLLLYNNILPDGGCINSPPSDSLQILENLLFICRNIEKTNKYFEGFRLYIDKITAFIKTMRYADKKLGIFFDGCEEETSKIHFILALSGVNTDIFKNGLKYSGYEFLNGNKLRVVFKKCAKLADLRDEVREDTKSLFSQEICVEDKRLVVNNGHCSPNRKFRRQNCSTVSFFKGKEEVDFSVKTLRDCKVEFIKNDQSTAINATYTGLKDKYGVVWHRNLQNFITGDCLLGEEVVIFPRRPYGITHAIVTFILHPDATCIYSGNGGSTNKVLLKVANSEWSLQLSGCEGYVKPLLYNGIHQELIPTYALCVKLTPQRSQLSWRIMNSKTVVDVGNYTKTTLH